MSDWLAWLISALSITLSLTAVAFSVLTVRLNRQAQDCYRRAEEAHARHRRVRR